MSSGSLTNRLIPAAAVVAVSTLRLAAQGAADLTLLTPGTVIERTLSGRQSHLYRLALAPSESATVAVDQRGIDIVAQVIDATGTVIAEFDSERGKFGQELLVVTAGAPVEYQLRIKARYNRDPAGGYRLQVSVRQATEKDRGIFEAHRLDTQSMAWEDAGKFDSAISAAEEALSMAQASLSPRDSYNGYLLFHLAELKRAKGDYSKSEELFRQSIALDEESVGREHPQTALALRALGQLYMERNDFANAEPMLQEALTIAEKTLGSEHAAVAQTLRLIANLHGYKEDLKGSAAYLQRSYVIAEKVFDPDDVSLIAIVHDLGNVYEVMGESDRAEPLLQRALAWVEEKLGPEHMRAAAPLHNLGAIAFQKHQYDRALNLFSRSKAIREKTLGPTHPQTVGLMLSIGNVYRALGDYTRALELDERALNILASTVGPQHRLMWTALEAMAQTYTAQGNLPAAVEYQSRYEDLLEEYTARILARGSEREKLAWFTWASSQTDRTISLHVLHAPEDPAARKMAALAILRHKGRVLDAMSNSTGALRERMDTSDRKLLDDLRTNNARLASLAIGTLGKTPAGDYRKRLAQLQERSEELEAAISTRSAAFRAQSQPVTLAAVQAAIPTGAALIEFASFRPFDPRGNESSDAYQKPHIVAYVLCHEGEVRWKELGPVSEINDAVRSLQEALRDSRHSAVGRFARILHERLMAPLAGLAGGAKHLLISPDGPLNLIPFEALVDEQGRYLLENYLIGYLTSGRDLLRMQVERSSRNAPLIVADPLFGEPGPSASAVAANRRSIATGKNLSDLYFAPLAGTREEARRIKTLFPEATLLTGQDASTSSLRHAAGPAILHIATHGFFLDDAVSAQRLENPLLRSGLALAGANIDKGSKDNDKSSKDNGILTALEASSLDLWGTKVVTLSACETGLGEWKNGEGVYGLRRSFFLAGAETLVMSLWPISDRVTRELMTDYYAGLKHGLGRGEALRHAQLNMLKRKDRQHPYFWASFIQSGQWRPI
jgi:CHAT domain-containing protein